MPSYEYLQFPLALRQIDARQMAQAGNSFKKALDAGLSADQTTRLADITSAWILNHSPGSRDALLELITNELNAAAPHLRDLPRQIRTRVHHAWAFESYQSRRWSETSRHAMQAVFSDSALLLNKGLMSAWARSAWASLHSQGAAISDQHHGQDPAQLSESARANVERLLGEAVQKWRSVSDDVLSDHRHRVYSFLFKDTRLIARVATAGEVKPPTGLMQRVLQAGVTAPEIVLAQAPAEHLQGIRIETFIEQASLDLTRFTPEHAHALITQIGEVIQQMQSIPVQGYGILNQALAGNETLDSMRDNLERGVLLALLNPAMPAVAVQAAQTALKRLDEHRYDGPPVFCHGDMQPENIRIANGQLSGLIDWEQAQGNDPAYDLAVFIATTIHYWYPDKTDAFIERVVSAGAGSLQPGMLNRVKAHLIIRTMFELNAAVKYTDGHLWRNADKMRRFLVAAADSPTLLAQLA